MSEKITDNKTNCNSKACCNMKDVQRNIYENHYHYSYNNEEVREPLLSERGQEIADKVSRIVLTICIGIVVYCIVDGYIHIKEIHSLLTTK